MEGRTKVRMVKKSFLGKWRVGEEGYIEACSAYSHLRFAIVLGSRIVSASAEDFEVIQEYSIKG